MLDFVVDVGQVLYVFQIFFVELWTLVVAPICSWGDVVLEPGKKGAVIFNCCEYIAPESVKAAWCFHDPLLRSGDR